MKNREEIGNLIYNARKDKNITQQELALKLNISDKAISNWETGKNIPDYEMIKRIEKILDIKILEEIEKDKNSFKIKILSFIIVVLLIPLIFLAIYFFSNYNQHQIYSLNIEDKEYKLQDSYLVVNKDQMILYLNEFTITDYPFQPDCILTLYFNNKNQKQDIITIDNYSTLLIDFNKDEYSKIRKDLLNNLNNLYLNVKYQSYDDKEYNKNIKINLTALAKKETDNQEVIDLNTINLLKNNNYQKDEQNRYVKTYDYGTFTYDVDNNNLYYAGTKDNKNIYAIYTYNSDGNEYLSYVMYDNDKVVEFKLEKEDTKEDTSLNAHSYYNTKELLRAEYKKIKI